MSILVLTDGIFPYGNAMSHRLRSFCKIFASIGYKVHVISVHTSDSDINSIRNLDYCSYQIVTKDKHTSKDTFIARKDFEDLIEKYISENQVDIVFSTSLDLYFTHLSKIMKKNDIKYFVEQCEWRDVSNFKLLYIDPRWIRDKFLKEAGYKKADGIIAISSLLEKHYKKQGINTIRIPTILDMESIEPSYRCSGARKKLVYTGNPGKSKEFLRPIIEAFIKSKSIRNDYEFHIYGPSKDLVEANSGFTSEVLDQVKGNVFIHGNVPQEEILDIIKDADFQIFLRPDRRSSNAGFPTKLGESLAVGTPVITNNTGDIALYLKDGVSGYILKDIQSETIIKQLEMISKLDTKKLENLRMNARLCAEENFDYRIYCKMIKLLFEK